MGSGIDSLSGLDSSSSLELALDRAIAQRWSSVQERPGRKRRTSPYPAALGLTYTPTPKLAVATSTTLTVASEDTALAAVPARLRWRGIEVTEEFQAYATRVERGEELAPYRGSVLSRPCAEFTWSEAPPALMLPPAPLPVYPERGRALKTALWVSGAVASIVLALGVGAGAANVPGSELDANVQSAALTLKPASGALVAPLRGEPASVDEIEHSDDSRLAPPSISAPQGNALSAPVKPHDAKKPTPASSARRGSPPEVPRLVDILRAMDARAASLPRAKPASRLSLPATSPAELTGPATVTTAALTGGRGSSLFSDQAPF